MNILMNKPYPGLTKQMSEDGPGRATKGAKGGQSKASKNLQLAKDLNAEMELMFADDDFKIK